MAQAQTAKSAKKGFTLPAFVVIIVALIVSELIFHFVFGDASHFKDSLKKEPKPGDYMGIIYKGGFIVPFLMTMFLVVITFAIERYLTIGKAAGTGNLETFLQNIKTKLAANDISGAMAECDKQKGSVQKMYGEEVYALFQKIKQIFDPFGLLNPGVKLASTNEDMRSSLRSNYSLDYLYKHMPRS